MLGVVVGGALPALAGHGALSTVFVLTLALGLTLLLTRARRPRRPASAPASVRIAQFAVPLGRARFRWLLAVFALNAIAPAITATVFQFFVLDRLQVPEAQLGVFLALYFVAGAVFSGFGRR